MMSDINEPSKRSAAVRSVEPWRRGERRDVPVVEAEWEENTRRSSSVRITTFLEHYGESANGEACGAR